MKHGILCQRVNITERDKLLIRLTKLTEQRCQKDRWDQLELTCTADRSAKWEDDFRKLFGILS